MAALPPRSGDQEGNPFLPKPWPLRQVSGAGEGGGNEMAPRPEPGGACEERRLPEKPVQPTWRPRPPRAGACGRAGPAEKLGQQGPPARARSRGAAFRGGRRSSRGSAPSPAAHGGAGSNLGRMGAAPRRQPPEDPFRRHLPPSSASRLNCGVRIDWECKWQLKCNLHSQQEQGGGKERATGGWPWAGGGERKEWPGWAKPPPQPQALPQTSWVIAGV